MNAKQINTIKNESKRVHDYLTNEINNRFCWIDLTTEASFAKEQGLSTVLLDDCVNPQVINAIKETTIDSVSLFAFFDFLELALGSKDEYLKEVLSTTIIEVLASEKDIKLESVLIYCGEETSNEIIRIKKEFFHDNKRAEELLFYLAHKYSSSS